jgi:cell division septal protein FtsQ
MPKRKSVLVKKKEQKRVRLAILVGVLALVALVGVYAGARAPAITIRDIHVDGTHHTNASALEDVVRAELSGTRFFLFPKKNTFFYPKQNIETELQERFAPLSSVSLTRDGFTALQVRVSERDPVAKWCAVNATTTPCYMLDAGGTLFITEDAYPGRDFVVFYGEGLTLGALFLDGEFPELYAFLMALQPIIQKTPYEVVIDTHQDVYVRFSEGGELRFEQGAETALLLDDVVSIFSADRLQRNEPFEYVDFRFGNKVYVKFVGE